MILSEFFKGLLLSSIMASVLLLIILFMKRILKNRLSPSWHYYIWLLLILRLIIPYAFESPVSIFNLFSPTYRYVAEVQGTIQTPVKELNSAHMNSSGADPAISTESIEKTGEMNANAENGTSYTGSELDSANMKNREIDLWMISTLIWLTGAMGLFVRAIFLNMKFSFLIQKQPHYSDEKAIKIMEDCKVKLQVKRHIPFIRLNGIGTPSIYGFISPKLLIPADVVNKLKKDELKHIVMHELVHLKRYDILLMGIAVLLKIVYWFNPLIWYGFYRMRQDCEISCDSHVLSFLQPHERKHYGQTIIHLADMISKAVHTPELVGIIKNRSNIKERIHKISIFKKPTWRWSALAIILFAVIAAIGLTNSIDFRKDGLYLDKDPGNTSGNISNWGLAAQDKAWIYYRNSEDGQKLYKSKSDGSGKTKLSDDAVSYINIVKDWVYYKNQSDSGNIYKMKTDGSGRVKLNDENSWDVNVTGDWIFYIDRSNRNIFRMKTDGTKKVKLNNDKAACVNVAGDWVYYCSLSEHQYIYKMKKDGSHKTLLSKDSAWSLEVVGNWIYYSNLDDDLRIYKLSFDSKRKSIVSDDSSIYFNVEGDRIYYSNHDDGNKLYVMSLEGNDKQELVNEPVSHISLVGDSVFYLNHKTGSLLYYEMDKNDFIAQINRSKVKENK